MAILQDCVDESQAPEIENHFVNPRTVWIESQVYCSEFGGGPF